ncbi:hypothetical protein AVEN_274439-1 [Araneus ventricosus]|uniref:Uncharacterized protein n=1 Tax=Araneus ventricosus TaxID=182803 RepID=A0A4Y2F3A5_ARAVE|nr:hypothetical protein AVEN_274439-1 [Araneus ventricosus]
MKVDTHYGAYFVDNIFKTSANAHSFIDDYLVSWKKPRKRGSGHSPCCPESLLLPFVLCPGQSTPSGRWWLFSLTLRSALMLKRYLPVLSFCPFGELLFPLVASCWVGCFTAAHLPLVWPMLGRGFDICYVYTLRSKRVLSVRHQNSALKLSR